MKQFLLAIAFTFTAATCAAQSSFEMPQVKPGVGVTGQQLLSHWLPALQNTPFDTPVYLLESSRPGATALVLGGTHPNELAGTVAAMVMVERVTMQAGRLIVVPFANRSALATKDTLNNIPQRLPLRTAGGIRSLWYGDRRSSVADQGPDPQQYVTSTGFVQKQAKAARNLNRVWPGRADGNGTEQVAAALITLIRSEKVNLVLDMHEARTLKSYDAGRAVKDKDSGLYNVRLANSLVAHPKGLELAAVTLMDVEEQTGVQLKLEESNKAQRGLSHLEIGEATPALAFLSESQNPGQDRWRKDPDVLNDADYPLKKRVALHLAIFADLMKNFAEERSLPFVMQGLPEYQQVVEKGVGPFLN